MKKLGLTLLSMIFLGSCSEDPLTEINTKEIEEGNEIETVEKNDLSLNPDLVILNQTNSLLLSGPQNGQEEALELTNLSEDIRSKLVEGAVLYIQSDTYTALRKIKDIHQVSDENVLLTTEIAHLGEMFSGGSLEFSIDILQAVEEKAKTKALSDEKYYEILRLIEDYKIGTACLYNPGIYLGMYVNSRLAFEKSQLLPSELSFEFVLRPEISPVLEFTSSVNQKYNTDLSAYLPETLLEFIKQQEFEVDIPINILGVESLPVKVSIRDIRIPLEIEANLSAESRLNYGVQGVFKVGYALLIDKLNIQSVPVLENTIGLTVPASADINGELITNAQIIITPDFTVLGNLYTISGDISMGVQTFTTAHVAVPGVSGATVGSKGIFTATMNADVDLLITSVKVDIINIEKELWDIGTVEKSVRFSDLQWKVSSSYSTNLLQLTRVYETDFSVKYKYAVAGKYIPDELLISYEVYQDNGTTRILSENDLVIYPVDITNDSFTFKLKIPYKKTLLSYQSKSYLRNIIIRDRNGYEYEGILNSNNGELENNFLIQR